MDSSANSLINPDARMGLAGAQPGAGAAGTGQAGGAADLGGLGSNLGGNFGQRLSGLAQMRGNPRAPLIFAVALLVAIVAGLFLWSRAPDYKVLYSNLSDRDGGAIITALQAANIPYKFSDAGGAILVPAEQVHEMRLRLASQGLPKSGSVGFELMDNQKFGISQFAEQINYQRALEGELERTIESISSVKSARVHLAIPKPSVFVRDKEAPSASVLVNLYPGRALDEGQVLAITHMVSSAVPDMPVKGVTILDQDGNLLTQPSTGSGLDASQLKYRQQIERNTQQRIDAILSPLFGSGNAHSQVSADIDFSHTEQTSENYGPNGNPQQSAIRSQQTSTATEMSQAGASGVPGALSNQPPQPASAPITAGNGASGVTTTPVSDRKDSTTNYELNKTVQHLEQPMGGIKRLSVAVVVNYLRVVDAKGHATMQPVTADKLAQVNQLVKDAMGFDQARGDSVNVVNSPFTADIDPDADLPWWRTPDMIALAKQIATYLGIGAVALFLYFVMVKPALRRAFPPPEPVVAAALPSPDEPVLLDGIPAAERAGAPTVAELESDNELLALENSKHKYERNLEFARNIARQDPKIVATVVKNWVSDER
ncbi:MULTISPECIES: flagellar basal-body MS-ring/collar protein FliF [Paraburkholderia]|uniref:Flagellar M-ring protein n=1 Tax=Paraburkholderia madseniana TaxID=2599607 RepID=A0AAP5BF26_9BURK|nr:MULTISPECIES: flagellar basal-body MS-ring/collar protein FliF [Paraburkholderia]MCX4147479.1 flagellar basal-body MS-ring/collar protein FliF [Paraburkholderia madseniana]MCX4172046.1 flagellar basal-body MS-ring/collar protein FliF [Paraburkholderia madseniana]MDN7150422.1 flagellar M-ring protein FliF [Paraburkholderia sp. WS6]MDQ6409302.1 flagellar M-ring protein FliF [Paraburkholderia madseniana]MDQ6460055.1 flagellar M-ring protein FliF [Paraburkholderia madseniana]